MKTDDEAIITEIISYYENNTKPVLLAQLGAHLLRQGMKPTGKLREVVDAIPGMTTVNHPTVLQMIAICRHNEKDETLKQLIGETGLLASIRRLSQAVLVAFCIELNEGNRIFLSKTNPPRYRISHEPLGDDYIEIPQDYRMSGTDIRSLAALDTRTAEDLYSNICKWAKDNNISIESLKKGPSPVSGPTLPVLSDSNALARFIRAQKPSIRHQIFIPLDIIEILLAHK